MFCTLLLTYMIDIIIQDFIDIIIIYGRSTTISSFLAIHYVDVTILNSIQYVKDIHLHN